MTYGSKLGPSMGKLNEAKPKKLASTEKKKGAESFLKPKRNAKMMLSKSPLLKGKINGS